jgi:hypothetical protein
MTELSLHPLCTLFPRLEGADFNALRDDIRVNGLREPIVMHDGMILDGGNRYRACLDAGVQPKFKDLNGGASNIVSYVLSANLHRRHMTPGQQAAIVALATDWGKAQTHGGKRKNDQGEALHLETVEQRAAQSGATTRTQKDADKLARNAPEKTREVAQGKKSLYQAVKEEKTSSLPKIVPRKEAAAKDAKLAAVDPLDKAREFAKKNLATIRSLKSDLAKRDATIESLNGLLAESRDNARDLADSLEAALKSGEGDAAVAKEIKKLNGQIRVLESQRDQYMTKCNELVKSVKALERKLDKCEAKK